MNLRGVKWTALIGLLGLGATSAIAGAIGLLTNTLQMEQSILDGSPFTSFTLPALILGGVVGGSQINAFAGLLRHSDWAILSAGVAGCIMVGWIVGEVILLGSDPGAMRNLQIFCFLLGALEAGLAVLLQRQMAYPAQERRVTV